MPRRSGKPTREGAVLRMFRDTLGLTDKALAAKAEITPQTVCLWECGKVPLGRDRLVEVLGCVDVPPEAVDTALLSQSLGLPSPGPSLPTAPPREERTLIHQTSAAVGQRSSEATRSHLFTAFNRREARRHRAWAEERWRRLEEHPPEMQEMLAGLLVHDDRSWALAERLCLASETAAAHRASEALRLARLAVRVAEQSSGPERWLLRLRGWCEPFLANALRVAGNLAAAEEAFARAEDLWARGAGGDPFQHLNGTRRLDLRASLLTFRGKFPEARQLLDKALAGVIDDHYRGNLLLKKANTFVLAGEYEASLAELRQAEPLIDEERDPRLLLVQRFNWVNVSCHLDRYEEADVLLGLVELLASDLGNELDQVRTTWLRGRTSAGLGRGAEALAVLSRARKYFWTEKIAYDFALVSLEVAVLHLEQGRTLLVQELGREMLWIFKSQKVHKEALAALTLFCQAAEGGEAGAEWIRRLVKYLYRAQHNPDLRFEP